MSVGDEVNEVLRRRRRSARSAADEWFDSEIARRARRRVAARRRVHNWYLAAAANTAESVRRDIGTKWLLDEPAGPQAERPGECEGRVSHRADGPAPLPRRPNGADLAWLDRAALAVLAWAWRPALVASALWVALTLADRWAGR